MGEEREALVRELVPLGDAQASFRAASISAAARINIVPSQDSGLGGHKADGRG